MNKERAMITIEIEIWKPVSRLVQLILPYDFCERTSPTREGWLKVNSLPYILPFTCQPPRRNWERFPVTRVRLLHVITHAITRDTIRYICNTPYRNRPLT
jgi:hypothetical protein